MPSRQRVCQRAVLLSCQQSRRPFGAALRATAGQDESMQRTFGNDDAAPDAGSPPRQRALRQDSRVLPNPGSPARHDDALRCRRPSVAEAVAGRAPAVTRFPSPRGLPLRRSALGMGARLRTTSRALFRRRARRRGRWASFAGTATPHAPKKRRGSKQAAKLTPSPLCRSF